MIRYENYKYIMFKVGYLVLNRKFMYGNKVLYIRFRHGNRALYIIKYLKTTKIYEDNNITASYY